MYVEYVHNVHVYYTLLLGIMQKNELYIRYTYCLIIIALLIVLAAIITLSRIEPSNLNTQTSLVRGYTNQDYSNSGHHIPQRKTFTFDDLSISNDQVGQKYEQLTARKSKGDSTVFAHRNCFVTVRDTNYKQFQYFMTGISSQLNLTATWDSFVKDQEKYYRFKEMLLKMSWMTPFSRQYDTGMWI